MAAIKGARLKGMNFLTNKLTSVGKASARFGVLVPDVRLVADDLGIVPRLTLDAVSYYDETQLRQVEHRLREDVGEPLKHSKRHATTESNAANRGTHTSS